MDFIIGIDGGGTKTVGIVADSGGKILGRATLGASNYHVIGETQTKAVLADLSARLLAQVNAERERCVAVCIGMAGLGRPEDQQVIAELCDEIGLPKRRILTHDARIALVGGAERLEGIIIIAGTGSIVYGVKADGTEARAGGWGHLLGDEGSGYDIGLRGLRAVVRAADKRDAPTQLTSLILDALKLRAPNDLIRWVHAAGKDRIAAVAEQVFAAATVGDGVATEIVAGAVHELVLAANVVIDRLTFNQPFHLVLSGGLFTHQPTFVEMLRPRLEELASKAIVGLPKHEPAYGAVLLAQNGGRF